jgi:predicted esterase
MVAYLGSYGVKAYGGGDLPKPRAVIMQYTAHSDYTKNDPPTFGIIGKCDSIADPRAMLQRINDLTTAGVDTEFHMIPNLGHGFGLGIGTNAEGWLEDAAAFWKRHHQL